MKTKAWLAALLLLAAAGSALAVARGGLLYVRARNTALYDKPFGQVLARLQPGLEVIWKGADSKDKRWHHVDFQGKGGVVFQSNLSPEKPRMELISRGGGAEVDTQAFVSSAAATKALGDGAVAYGEKQGYTLSVQQLLVLEALALKVKPEDVERHAKEMSGEGKP